MVLDFKAVEHQPPANQTQIPEGWYLLQIGRAELLTVGKRNPQHSLRLPFVVVSGEHAGHIAFRRIHLDGGSGDSERVERSQQMLVEVCGAVGVEAITDTDELLGKRLVAFIMSTRISQFPTCFRSVCPEDLQRLDHGLPLLERYDASEATVQPEQEAQS